MPSTSQRSSQVIERYGSGADFLKTFNPAMQYRYCADVGRCFTGHAPSLGLLKQAYGGHIAESWLEIQLRDLSEFSGCKDKLSLRQIEDTAKVIIAEFDYLKVSELMLFFVQFKAGRYGRFYGAVDGLVITQALQEFCAYRRDELERHRRQQEKEAREKQRALWAQDSMNFDEWQEISWLFNLGYEPWRIKAELEQQRKQNK